MLIRVIILSLILTQLSACALRANEKSRSVPSEAQVLGTRYATLVFSEGKAELTERNRRELNALAIKANRDGEEIESYKILAWSDQEYPVGHREASPGDVRLAQERARSIKKYLSEELNAQERVQTFNMARPPTPVSRAVRSEEWLVKETFQGTGASASRLPNGQMSYTKASKALVIIDYKDHEPM